MSWSQVIVDYQEKDNRFTLQIPFYMNEIAKGLPNRKWSAAKKCWTAPAVRANAQYIKDNLGLATVTDAAKDAIRRGIEGAQAPVIPFPKGYKFKTEPMDHQRRALDKSWGPKNFAFFMDMGTGKTKVAIDLLSARAKLGEIQRVLVVCPNSIKSNWQEEIEKHATITSNVGIVNLDKKELPAFPRPDTTGMVLQWLVVAVESIQGSQRAIDAARKFLLGGTAAMVVDESSRIKNPQARRAKTCVELGEEAAYRYVLTGTPVTQGILDLYMQFEFLDPNIIGVGDHYSFRNQYAVMGGFEQRQVIGYQNVEQLMDLIRPFVFEVSKEEGLPDLPPKTYETRTVQLNTEQKRIYKTLKADLAALVGGKEIDPKNVLEKMLRLQQVVGGFYSVVEEDPLTGNAVTKEFDIEGENPKVRALLEVLEETRGSVIIWCRFKREIRYVASALREVYGEDSVVEFHGDVSVDNRRTARHEFQAGVKRFFVGTTDSGGIGLTLTAAKTVIYFSNNFSLELRKQSEDRAHRKGQEDKVLYIDLIAEGTIDRVVLAALRQKQDIATFVYESIKHGTLRKELEL